MLFCQVTPYFGTAGFLMGDTALVMGCWAGIGPSPDVFTQMFLLSPVGASLDVPFPRGVAALAAIQPICISPTVGGPWLYDFVGVLDFMEAVDFVEG